jgi:hypothetical protein
MFCVMSKSSKIVEVMTQGSRDLISVMIITSSSSLLSALLSSSRLDVDAGKTECARAGTSRHGVGEARRRKKPSRARRRGSDKPAGFCCLLITSGSGLAYSDRNSFSPASYPTPNNSQAMAPRAYLGAYSGSGSGSRLLTDYDYDYD